MQQPLWRERFYLDAPPAQLWRGRRMILYSVFLLMLGLGLIAGYAFYAREWLRNSPTSAAWMTKACAYIDCQIKYRRDVGRVKIIDRNIYSRPDRPNTLFITATVVNKAPFAQPYPLMQLSLTNLQGTVIATRRFNPREYVSPPSAARALMTPNNPIKVRAAIQDPGVDAVAFEFAFL